MDSPGGLIGMPEGVGWGQTTSGWNQEQVAWLTWLTTTQRASVCTPPPSPPSHAIQGRRMGQEGSLGKRNDNLRDSDSFKILFIYLFLAILGLCCCADFSLVAAPGLQSTGSVVVVHTFSCSWHMGSSQIRDQTCIFCIGRQILYH